MEKPDKIKSVEEQFLETFIEKGLPILKRNLGIKNDTEETKFEDRGEVIIPSGLTEEQIIQYMAEHT